MEWLTNIVYPILGLALGGGAIGTICKARKDAKLGIRSADTADDIAQSDRWKTIIETQTKVLLDPLTAQVASLSGKVAGLEIQVETLESERRQWHRQRFLYWSYTNLLRDHINEGKGPPAPEPPVDLDFTK